MTFADTAQGPNREAADVRRTLWYARHPDHKTMVERSTEDDERKARVIAEWLRKARSRAV